MKKLNMKGVIGVTELGAMAVLIVMVGFVSFRIASVNNEVNESLSNAESSSESLDLEAIKIAEAEEAKKEIDLPDKEEVKEEEKPVEVVKEEPKEEPKEEEPVKVKPTYINFTKGGGSQQGDNVVVSASLESDQTGTCHFKFKKDGYSKVYLSDSISNSKVCDKNVPVAEFEASGDWLFYVWFVSSDKKVEAYQDAYTIEVTL